MRGCGTLFALAARPLILAEMRKAHSFCALLPPPLCIAIEGLATRFREIYANASDLVSAQQLVCCLKIDRDTRQILVAETIEALEDSMDPLDFFDLCTRYCLEEATSRLYDTLSNEQCADLLKRHSVVQCRLHELHNAGVAEHLRRFRERNSISVSMDESSTEEWAQARRDTFERGSGLTDIYYERVALACAISGYFDAFERSLGKIESLEDVILPQCELEAIRHGQYHIANRIAGCDNYDKAFYLVFPDGRVPADFFSALLDADLVKEGERIATALLNYLPRFDVQRLRRAMETDQSIAHRGLLRKFDTMYSEVLDQRDYPYDAEW